MPPNKTFNNSQWARLIIVFSIAGLSGLLLSLYLHKHSVIINSVSQNRVFHYPTAFVQGLKDDPNAGEKVYKEFCASCHAQNPVIPIVAPRVGVKKDWYALQQLPQQQLLAITAKGIGPMPARGGCFECSDDLLLQAIQYMLLKSRAH